MADNDKIIDEVISKVSEEHTDTVEHSVMVILHDMKDDPKKYRKMYISSPLIGIIASSWIMQMIYTTTGRQKHYYILNFLTAWMSSPLGILMMIGFTVFSFITMLRFKKLLHKDFYVDRDEKYKIAEETALGDAHWQTEEEREKCFEMGEDIDDVTGNILGKDENGRLYALRQDLVAINKNKIAFGPPGIGKSVCIIDNDIVKSMQRGESLIITDSKGDLYKKFCQIGINAGYVVRALNLKPAELRNSDGFHLLKYLDGGRDTASAEMLANAIIEMTSGHRPDYWSKNEMNGYKALLLYISSNETFIANGEDTLAKMYEICTTLSSVQLITMFDQLPNTHPAKQAFNIYVNCKPEVQGQILNGMGLNLGFLIDNNAKEIVSHDEIDLVLPMKRKCMYFVILPDTNSTYNVIANLFFNMMITKQIDYSDSLDREAKKKQLAVNYVMDEFFATGGIAHADKVLGTARSRKVSFTIIVQTLGMLKDLYQGEAWDTILGCISTKILLRAGDETTAKYFSTNCGTQTRQVVSRRYNQAKTDLIPIHNQEQHTVQYVGEDLLPISHAMELDSDYLIVCVSGFKPVKLRKYLSDDNPYLFEYEERLPGLHKPKWRKQKEEKEAELKARREAAAAQPAENVPAAAAPGPAGQKEPAKEVPVTGYDAELPVDDEVFVEDGQKRMRKAAPSEPDKENKAAGPMEYVDPEEEKEKVPGLPTGPSDVVVPKRTQASKRKGSFKQVHMD